MTTWSRHMQRLKDSGLRYAQTVVRCLIEPSAIWDEKQRRRMRLLSAFLLLIALNTFIGTMAVKNTGHSMWLILLVTAVILMFGYGFSRTRYYRLATLLAVTMPAIPILAMTLFSDRHGNIPAELPWLALPLLVSSLLLSLRNILIIAIAYIAVIIILIPFVNVPIANLYQSLAFIFMIFFFVIAITEARQQDQAETEHQLTERKRAEEILRESEEKYRAIFDQASDSIVLIDTETAEIVDFNDNAHQNLGYSRQEFAKLKITDIDAIDSLEDAKRRNEKVLKEGMATFETKHRTKSGNMRHILASSRLINISGKDLSIAVWHDITERKRAEEKLQESEEFSSSLMRSSAVPILVVNDDTSMRYVNPAFEKLTGFTLEEIIGEMAPYPWWLGSKSSGDVNELKADVHTGVRRLEKLFQRKTGEHFWVEITSAPVKRDGKFQYSLENWLDITERKQAEEKLRESEEKFSKAFHASPDAISINTLKDGTFLEVNDNFTRVSGYTREEVIGHSPIEIGLWAKAKERDRMLKILKEQGRVSNEEFEFRVKSGEMHNWLYSSEVINIGDEPCLIVMSIDITERKRTEEALRESEQKYRAIFDQAVDSIALIDIETGEMVDFNNKAHENLGYSREEFAKLRIQDIDPNLEADSSRDNDINQLENTQRVIEAKHRAKSGEIRDVRISTTFIRLAGRLVGICIWHDITEEKKVAEAMREREKRFSDIAENALEWIWEVDTNGKYTYSSHVVEEILGYKPEEVLQKHFYDLLHPEDRGELKKAAFEVFAQKQPFHEFINRNVHKNGETVWLSTSGVPIIDEEGNLLGYRGADTDITERKRAEEKLRESEQKYRAIFDQASDSIVLIDQDTAEIVDFNDRAYQNLGYSREEFAKLKIQDIDIIESAEEAKKRNEKIRKEGIDTFETKHRTKNGEIRDILVGNRGFNIGGKTFSLAVWHDITERKRAEEKLRESEEKYRAIFDQASDSIVLIDTETEAFVDFNDRTHQNLGYTRQEFAKLKVTDVDAVQSHEDTIQHLKKTYGGETDVFETKHRTKGGEIRDILVSIKMLNIGGRISSLAVCAEVTERRRAEEKIKQALSELENSSTQLAATNKELEAFSYSVSHDLRAPLRTIDGFSQALLEDNLDKLDEQGQDYLQRIRSASQRMGILIDDLLKLSRLSRSEMHQEPVDLSALAKEVATNLRQTEPERHVKFAISRGLIASGDRQLLRIALENLLGNAWKFTGKRQQAEIEVGITQNGDKKAYFVRDNGAGFDMTYANKLFGAFQRLHETTEFPGTGIGLATVQRIVHRHGGSIWAEGAVGEGATFYFTIN